MLYIAVILTVYSMCNYLYVAFKAVFGKNKSQNYNAFEPILCVVIFLLSVTI